MRGQFMVSIKAIDDAECDDAILGAWLKLVRYCAGKLNGGRIVGAKAWKVDRWLMYTRVPRRVVEEVIAIGMARWDGDDLVIENYDTKGDAIYLKQRDEGHKRAAARWGNRQNTDQGHQDRSPTEDTDQEDREGDREEDRHGHGGGMAKHREIPMNNVPRGTDTGIPVSTHRQPSKFNLNGPATTWSQKNPNLLAQMVANFQDPAARIIDVLRYFRVKFDARGEALEGEWQRDTNGQQPAEVFLVFANAADGSIRLPSQYRAARKAFEAGDAA